MRTQTGRLVNWTRDDCIAFQRQINNDSIPPMSLSLGLEDPSFINLGEKEKKRK